MKPLSVIGLPCVFISNATPFWAKSYESFTWCTSYGVKTGYFDDLHLIDRSGTEYSVVYAGVERGAGRFGGYNLFFNRRFYAKLFVTETGRVYSLGEMLPMAKKLLKVHLRSTEFEELLSEMYVEVSKAVSIDDLYILIEKELRKREL